MLDFGRLDYGLEFYYTTYQLSSHTISLLNNSINFNTNISKNQGSSQGLKIILAYRFSDRWRLYFSTLGNFSSARLRDSGIGISHRQPLSIKSRFSIQPHIGLYIIQYTVDAGTISLQEKFSVNRVKFDLKNVKLFSGTSSNNISSGVSLHYELTYCWSFKVGFNYC